MSEDERKKLQALLRENHVTPEDAQREARTGKNAAHREELRFVKSKRREPKGEKNGKSKAR